MALLLKSLLGAIAVLLISLLANSRHYYLAGLVPLFPTFALIAHYFVGSDQGPSALQQTALFGLAALIPYAIYLLCVYLLASKLSLVLTLTLATCVWLLAAALLLLLWPH